MSTQRIQHWQRSLRRRRRAVASRRRGVLLLVILSILIIFLMTAVSFVLVTQHYNKASKAISKADAVATDSGQLLDAALYELLRDTNNPLSRIRYHSLLRDLYGNDQITGTIANATWIGGSVNQDKTGGQLIHIDVKIDASFVPKVSTLVGHFNGCLLTLEDGPAKGHSLRIVHSKFDGTQTLTLQTTAPKSDLVVAKMIWPLPGNRLVINGRPFNGTGVGYNPDTNDPDYGKCNAVDGVHGQYALLPNPVFFEVSDQTTPYYGDRTGTILPAMWEYPGIGGSDESYDAADFQNMFLALLSSTPSFDSMDDFVLPSFHRPALINYWMNKTGMTNQEWNEDHFSGSYDAQNAALARKVVLRPLPIDHPNFPPLNNLVLGPWDVDNDKDGIPESVWVDLGSPIMKGKDGRLYKPMYAILCQDLDGRLNLNAHGSREDVVRGRPASDQVTYLADAPGNLRTADSRPAGQGYGPAEITLNTLIPAADYVRLLIGNGVLLGRYGADQMPGWDGVHIGNGNTNIWDIRAQIRFFQYPIQFLENTIRRGFMTPPDLKGRFGLGVDFQGFANFRSFQDQTFANDPSTDESMAAESAYESDLLSDESHRASITAADTPFTVAELEKVLRAYDADVGTLPDRLRELAGSTFFIPNSPASAENRRLVTTRSIDLPVPSAAMTRDLKMHIMELENQGKLASPPLPIAVRNRLLAGAELTVSDLLLIRILDEIDPNSPPGGLTLDDFLNLAVRYLLAIDLVDGLRMDVNRPFGDGRDNDGDFAVDEPGEANFAPPLRPVNVANVDGTTQTVYQDMPMDVNREIPSNFDIARQLYARHLYVLAMILVDKEYEFPTDQGGLDAAKFKAQRLAQWAVNAADFRDPDAVMTGFEYDVNPFDGWDVDGDLATNEGNDRGVVWGCEQPQLLLTETLAFHNLRAVDSANDIGSGKKHWQKAEGNEKTDTDLDQYRVPQGSAFFELFCVGNPNNRVMPAELYTYHNGVWKLDLGRRPTGSNDPVWRLAISRFHRAGESVRSEFRQKPETYTFQPDTAILDRFVTFSDVPPTSGSMTDRTFWNRTGTPALVPPGHYAVVGPRPRTVISSKEVGMLREEARHAIELNPNIQPNPLNFDDPVNQAQSIFVNHDTIGHPWGHNPTWFGLRVKQAVSIIASMNRPSLWTTVNTPVGVNISEPLPTGPNYYPEPTKKITGFPDTDAYGDLVLPTEKLPGKVMDLAPSSPIHDLAQNTNPVGLHRNTRTVFLQRLADPTRPWDIAMNPYLTVDWLPIDLTIYNGEDRHGRVPGVAGEISNEYPGWCEEDRYRFASRERGLQNGDNIWRSETEDDIADSRPQFLDSFFRHNLVHTLGYLNHVFSEPLDLTQLPFYSLTTTEAVNAKYQALGAPMKPFPWLTWNDRPFVSPLEMMLVPFSSPGRLTVEHTTADNSLNPYEPDKESNKPDHIVNKNATFGHLLNFFCTSDETPHTGTGAPHLYRLFDYLGVPTRFVGGQTYLNPVQFGSGAGTYDDGTQFRRPPFNRISEYREPGRINLNTIVHKKVYDALFHRDTIDGIAQHEHPGPEADEAAKSRQGYSGAAFSSIFALNENYPTFFANPYRSADAGELVPLSNMEREGIDCSLLRREPNATSGDEPLFYEQSNQLFDDTDRNPYFRYQPTQRLANLVTTRSNVYAIWITVGFFEVQKLDDADPVSASIIHRYGTNLQDAMQNSELFRKIYPDGTMLGRELGADTGAIQRHRAFYIVDRSIPVGFAPGKDLNVDRAILLRRQIE